MGPATPAIKVPGYCAAHEKCGNEPTAMVQVSESIASAT